MSSFELISLDTGNRVLRAPKKEDEGILQGGSKVYGDQPVIGSVTNLQALRDAKYQRMKAGDNIYSKSHTTQGDGGEGNFRLVTGAPPGTYVDNNGTIIVPTGGDGSAAWIKDFSTTYVPGGYKFRYLTGATSSLAASVPKGIQVGDTINVTQFAAGSPVCPATWQLVDDDAALPEGAVAGDVTGAAAGCLYLENGGAYYQFQISGTFVFPEMFGPTGTSDDRGVIDAAVYGAHASGIKKVCFSRDISLTSGGISILSGMEYEAIGPITVTSVGIVPFRAGSISRSVLVDLPLYDIDPASAGDSACTLTEADNAEAFSVDDYVYILGGKTFSQDGVFYEFGLLTYVTSINGSVISFKHALDEDISVATKIMHLGNVETPGMRVRRDVVVKGPWTVRTRTPTGTGVRSVFGLSNGLVDCHIDINEADVDSFVFGNSLTNVTYVADTVIFDRHIFEPAISSYGVTATIKNARMVTAGVEDKRPIRGSENSRNCNLFVGVMDASSHTANNDFIYLSDVRGWRVKIDRLLLPNSPRAVGKFANIDRGSSTMPLRDCTIEIGEFVAGSGDYHFHWISAGDLSDCFVINTKGRGAVSSGRSCSVAGVNCGVYDSEFADGIFYGSDSAIVENSYFAAGYTNAQSGVAHSGAVRLIKAPTIVGGATFRDGNVTVESGNMLGVGGAPARILDVYGSSATDVSARMTTSRDVSSAHGSTTPVAELRLRDSAGGTFADSGVALDFRTAHSSISPDGVVNARLEGYGRTGGSTRLYFWVASAALTLTRWMFLTHQGTLAPENDNAQTLGGSSNRWLNAFISRITIAPSVIITSGAGSPEGVVAAGVGSLYTRTDGGAGTTLYCKETGTGNTGWVAK